MQPFSSNENTPSKANRYFGIRFTKKLGRSYQYKLCLLLILYLNVRIKSRRSGYAIANPTYLADSKWLSLA